MSVDHVSAEIGVSSATVYRFEAGTSVPRPGDVERLCAVCGVDGDFADALVALAKEADSPGWWRSYNGAIPRWFDLFVSLEGVASHIRAYDSEVIFGLLQTRRYVEAMVEVDALSDGADLDDRVAVRLERQRILTRRNPPRLDVILGETALLRSPDADIMVEQLTYLDKLSRRPNVTIRLLPLSILHCALNCSARFTMLSFATDRRGMSEPPIVFADNLTGAAYLDQPEEIRAYNLVWEGALKVALGPGDSRNMINSYLERYQQ